MKTDYVLRRRALLGISALFCTTLLLFGCQDSADPVGPELDSLEFSDGADGLSKGPDCTKNPDNPNCGDPGDPGGDPAATLSLTLGMSEVGDPFEVEVGKDTDRTLKVSNANFMKPTITMGFSAFNCTGIPTGGKIPEGDDFNYLVEQLLASALDAKVVMYIDKTSLSPPEESDGHSLIVQYAGASLILPGYSGTALVTKSIQADVFTFTGPVEVWSNRKGISCPGEGPGQVVEVTLTR